MIGRGPGLLSTGCFGSLLSWFICLILKIFIKKLAILGGGSGGVYGSQFRVRNTLGEGLCVVLNYRWSTKLLPLITSQTFLLTYSILV